MVQAGFMSAAIPWMAVEGDRRPRTVPDAGVGAGDDRRGRERRALFATGQMTLDDGDTSPTSAKRIQVDVLNVSTSGVGFRSPVPFALGATHHLRIGTGPLYLSSYLQIVSSRRRDDGTHDVGAKFM